MDLSIKSDTLATADQSWLGSAHGTENCRPITLDVSAFTEGTHYPDGFFKSGLPLGKITATGLYAPYAAGTNEVQVLTRTSTGGTITLNIDGEVTAAIAASAAGFTATAVQTAINALSNVDEEHTVTVTGSAGGPLSLTYGGLWSGEDIPTVIVDNTSATGGTIVASTGTAGAAGASDGTQIFAGFLFDAPKAPAATTTDVQGALFEHGRVVEANLPIAVDTPAKNSVAGRIIFA